MKNGNGIIENDALKMILSWRFALGLIVLLIILGAAYFAATRNAEKEPPELTPEMQHAIVDMRESLKTRWGQNQESDTTTTDSR